MNKSESLNEQQKDTLAVALSNAQATQSLLTPLTATSLVISKADQHIREALILMSLALYNRDKDING